MSFFFPEKMMKAYVRQIEKTFSFLKKKKNEKKEKERKKKTRKKNE